MHRQYKDQAEFISIYVREAHPVDGASSYGNDAVGIRIRQHRTLDERFEAAQTCCAALHLKMPLLIDTIDDRVGHAYSAMPDRLYIVDRAGKIAYKGGRGPFGFKPGEMEQSLVMTLLEP